MRIRAFALFAFLVCPLAARAENAPVVKTESVPAESLGVNAHTSLSDEAASAASENAIGDFNYDPSGIVKPLLTEADTMVLCQEFLDLVVAGRYDEGFNRVRPYFPVSQERVGKIQQETKQQVGMAELQFGKALGTSFMSGKALQGNLLRLRFLQTFERDVIYWEFVFYRAPGGWMVNALGFDDELRALFE